MKILIDIDEDHYKVLQKMRDIGLGYYNEAILNGTVVSSDDASTKSIRGDIVKEILENYGSYDICEYYEDYDYEENDISEYRPVGTVDEIVDIINKHMEW